MVMEMRKKKVIRTSNKEIYEKFNLLHFSPEVVIKKPSNYQLSRMLKNINKEMEILEIKDLGEYLLVKKKRPLNFKIYFK